MPKLLEVGLEPILTTQEYNTAEIAGLKEGQKVRAILTYKVVETTRSYIILNIKFVSVIKTKRAF